MPAASSDELPEREIAPGYSSRYEDWGGMIVAFESAPAGTDPGPMVKGLPDDRCQAYSEGFVNTAQTREA
jgi:hypothetical protein